MFIPWMGKTIKKGLQGQSSTIKTQGM